MASKVLPLESLGDLVADGATVGVGGAWFANHPMAALRQLVRAGRRDLRAISLMGSIDIDLLAAAGVLGHLTFSMVTLEAFGLATNVRRAVESGRLPITEVTGVGLMAAFEAQGRGVPYLPYRGPLGSQIPALSPDIYSRVVCPFTGENLTAVRALSPDVAIVHALRADHEGNAQWDGTTAADVEMAKAAKQVIVTCEEIVPRDVIVRNAHMTKLPGFYVDAVIEAPFGAHPTSHVPRYTFDAWQILQYSQVAAGAGRDSYVARLAEETEVQYRHRVLGAGRGEVLTALAARARPIAPKVA